MVIAAQVFEEGEARVVEHVAPDDGGAVGEDVGEVGGGCAVDDEVGGVGCCVHAGDGSGTRSARALGGGGRFNIC